MNVHTTDAVLVTGATDPRRAQLAAGAFLARYNVLATRVGYGIAIRQWFTWCEGFGIDPLEAKRSHIEVWARELEANGNAQATIGSKLNALAGFYRFSVLDDVIEANPMVHVRRPRINRESTSNGLHRAELSDMMVAAEKTGPQAHAFVCLGALNGMRVSEITGLDVEHLGFWKGHNTAHLMHRKGGKSQTLPLAPRTAWAVESLKAIRGSGPLFLSLEGNRLDRRGANRIVKKLCAEIGVTRRITPHSLRHTFVTLSLDAGVSERDISASTGHADTRMIAFYDRNRDNMSRNATHALTAYIEGAA